MLNKAEKKLPFFSSFFYVLFVQCKENMDFELTKFSVYVGFVN